MERCPDQLTIQALADGDEQDSKLQAHIRRCPRCSDQYRQLSALIKVADGLKSEAKLPVSFYRSLEKKINPAPFPAALVAASIFALALLSLLLLGPSHLEWWLSVGITHQVGLIIDAFLDLLALSSLLNPAWIVAGLAAIVAIELLILRMLNNVEELQNA